MYIDTQTHKHIYIANIAVYQPLKNHLRGKEIGRNLPSFGLLPKCLKHLIGPC